MTEFFCDLSQAATPLPHFWEECVGSGNATLALRADYQQQLKRCHAELGFKRVRFHGWLLDQLDAGRYSFINLDKIVDFLASIDMCPLIETSFMPAMMASGKKTVFSYRGNVTPPRDYRQWSELIGTLVAHWRRTYRMRDWMFEVWNEPNLKSFWTSTQQEYFTLYRRTFAAIKEQDAKLRVGGPATAQNQWIEDFLDACEADFVSTHHYPNDPPYDKTQPPRSILREWAQDAHRRACGVPLFYTEWNTCSNDHDSRHDEPFAAAYLIKTLMEATGLVAGYSFWTFSDIFAEEKMPSIPFHGGFGLMNVHGIPKPMYRAFELLRDVGTELLLVDGMHPAINAWVVRKSKSATVLLTNLDPEEHASVRVMLRNPPRSANARLRRIDDEHANPRRLWCEMGRPKYLRPAQVDSLEEASRLRSEKIVTHRRNNVVQFELKLPPLSVAAITL